MAEFRSEKKRKSNEIPHVCPPGKHWVKGHYAGNTLGIGSHWVKGYCAKDGDEPGMQVTRQSTKTKTKLLNIFEREREIVEEPIREDEKVVRDEKDDSH